MRTPPFKNKRVVGRPCSHSHARRGESMSQELRAGRYSKLNSLSPEVMHTASVLGMPPEPGAQGTTLLSADTVETLLIDRRQVRAKRVACTLPPLGRLAGGGEGATRLRPLSAVVDSARAKLGCYQSPSRASGSKKGSRLGSTCLFCRVNLSKA